MNNKLFREALKAIFNHRQATTNAGRQWDAGAATVAAANSVGPTIILKLREKLAHPAERSDYTQQFLDGATAAMTRRGADPPGVGRRACEWIIPWVPGDTTWCQHHEESMNRYQVTTVHGESATIHHVVDTIAPESEQPTIVASYSTADHRHALGLAYHRAGIMNGHYQPNRETT